MLEKTSIRINGLIKIELEAGKRVELIAALPTASMWNGLPVDRVTGLESGLVNKNSQKTIIYALKSTLSHLICS